MLNCKFCPTTPDKSYNGKCPNCGAPIKHNFKSPNIDANIQISANYTRYILPFHRTVTNSDKRHKIIY